MTTAPVRANPATQPNATVRPQSATAPTPDAILLIHGIDFLTRNPVGTALGWSGTDCEQVWSQTEDAFARWGYPRDQIQTVGYYQNSSNCSVDLSKRYQGEIYDGIAVGDDITTNTPINLIGWRLARYIYETYTVRGKTVAIVTHSMGGLIARYAIGGAAQGMFSEWGVNALRVQSLVTLAGPHAGSERNASLLSQFLRINDLCGLQCDQMLPNSAFLTALNSSIDNNASTVSKRLTLGSTADGIVPVLSASGAPGVHLTYSAPDYTHTAFQGGAGQMKNDMSENHDATWYAIGDTDIEEGSRPACAVAQFVFGGCRSAYGFTVNTISFPDETGQNIAIVGKTCGSAPYVEGIDIAGFLEFRANQNATDAKLLLDGTLITDSITDSGTRGTGRKYIILSTPKPYSFSPPSGVSTTAGEHTLTIEATISNPETGLAPQRMVKQAVFTAVPKENCSNPPSSDNSIPATGYAPFDNIDPNSVLCAGYGSQNGADGAGTATSKGMCTDKNGRDENGVVVSNAEIQLVSSREHIINGIRQLDSGITCEVYSITLPSNSGGIRLVTNGSDGMSTGSWYNGQSIRSFYTPAHWLMITAIFDGRYFDAQQAANGFHPYSRSITYSKGDLSGDIIEDDTVIVSYKVMKTTPIRVAFLRSIRAGQGAGNGARCP